MRILTPFFCTLMVVSIEAAGQTRDPLEALAEYTGNEPQELIHVGDLFVEANRLKDAKKIYRKAERHGASKGEVLLGNARILLAQGQFNQAKKTCLLIGQKFAQGVEGEMCFGWYWLSNGQPARALEDFQKVVQKGDLARGKMGLAEALRSRGDFETAVAAYNEAIGAGASYLAYVGRGLAEKEFGDQTAAMASLKTAVSLEPASCLARFEYGRLLKPDDEAAKQLEMALKLRPGWPQAVMELGSVLMKLDEYQKAVEVYKSINSGESGSGEAFYAMGRAYFNEGNNEAAGESLQKAIKLIPNHKGAFLLLADIHFEAGNSAGAIEALEQARRAAPEDPSVFVKSGEIFYKMEQHERARSFLQQAVSLNPKLSTAQAILGHIACQRDLYDAGIKHYDAALKGDLAGVDDREIKSKRRACRAKTKK